MAQQIRTRPQARSISYSANNKVSESLSRGMLYREIYLRLSGQLTVSAANNTAANTLQGDEWAAVQRIELIANGTDVIRSFDANALWWMNYFYYNRSPKTTPTLGDGSTLNPSFDSLLILPLWMPKAVRPLDTALDSGQLSSLEVRITWGSHTSINASATGFTTNPTIEMGSLESFNFTGPFSQLRVFKIEKEITASNERFQVDLPVGKMYRGFLMNYTDAGADDADVLNNFKLISGTTVFADQSKEILRQTFPLRSGVGPDASRRGNANNVNGWFVYDHVTDGFLSEAIDTLGFSEFKMELDVTIGSGTTKAIIYPFEIIPVRGAQNNG